MNKEFVTYGQALALKELGFDEPCLGMYHTDSMFVIQQTKSHSQYYGQICSAPLKQQVFKWFREKLGLHGKIDCYYNENFYVNIEELNHPRIYTATECKDIGIYSSYDEAENKSINKLIEIVKNRL